MWKSEIYTVSFLSVKSLYVNSIWEASSSIKMCSESINSVFNFIAFITDTDVHYTLIRFERWLL
jgi:hypothetical protein